MTKQSLFLFNDYKQFLRFQTQASRGEISRAAEAANCQKSHLSRVIGTHIHLTTDQAYDLCSYWKLKPAETEYFLCLVEHARTGSAERRKYLLAKITELKRNESDIANRVKRATLSDSSSQHLYYSSWHMSAIHILVSIPDFQTPNAISKKLCLPVDVVKAALESLQQMGLIKNMGDKWIFASQSIHLPSDSPFVSLHHNNWRQRAVLSSAHKHKESLHYTSIQSMTMKCFEQIREKILQTIDEANALAGPSREEELVCFNIDFFLPNG